MIAVGKWASGLSFISSNGQPSRQTNALCGCTAPQGHLYSGRNFVCREINS